MPRKAKVTVTELGSERLCNTCGDYWPEDSEFFYIGRRNGRKGTFVQQPCKACYSELPSRKARKAKRQKDQNNEILARCHRLFLSGFPARGRTRLHPSVSAY